MKVGALEHPVGIGGLVQEPPSQREANLPLPLPKALWFGDSSRPLFGWYHAPRSQPRASVVLCSTFGHEEMSTHRGYLHLAQRLAKEGYAVLRFDYDGSGDSAGEADDPNRVEAWLASIAKARTTLVELSRATNVVLFGLRLGALLALTYASSEPVDALVLFALPASGKAWVREMRALAMMRESQFPNQAPTPESGIVGFPLPDQARSDLSALNWKASGKCPARTALVIPRDDLPTTDGQLVAQLSAAGTDTVLRVEPGYAAFLQDDPVKAQAPERVFDATIEWLNAEFAAPSAQLTAVAGPSSSRAGYASSAAQVSGGVREEVVHPGGLFGVISEPSEPGVRAAATLVLLNIGANHHVGSNRMYVTLGRRLAGLGFRCLRLDFSGIGDSGVPMGGRENDVYSQRFFQEVRNTIDFLSARGVEKFVLGGLCSGAYAAYHTATGDPRVSGVVLINPLTFHWNPGDSLEVRTRQSFKSTTFYKRALGRPETWMRLVKGKVDFKAVAGELMRRSERRARRELRAAWAKFSDSLVETTDVERGFRTLSNRGAHSLLLFGSQDGGIDVIEEHLGQNAQKMRAAPNFVMKVLEGPDHTFTPLWTQRTFSDLVTGYMIEHFGEREK